MKPIVLAAMCLLFFGCSSINRVNSKNSSDEELINRFNDHAQKRSAQIFLSNGQQNKGSNLRITDKTLVWTDNGVERYYSTDSIYKIQFTARGSMGVKVALIFFGIMVIDGIVDGASGQEGEATFGLIRGLMFSPIAFLAGYLIGEHVDYVFGDAPVQQPKYVTHNDVNLLRETNVKIKIEWKTQNSLATRRITLSHSFLEE